MNWETVFASYVPEKQSISAIDKDLLCANNNNEINTWFKMPQEFEDTFPQRTYTNCHQVWSDFFNPNYQEDPNQKPLWEISPHILVVVVSLVVARISKPENRPRENGSVITQIKQGVAVLVYDPSTGSGTEIRRTEAGLPEWRSSRFRERACLKHTDDNSNAGSNWGRFQHLPGPPHECAHIHSHMCTTRAYQGCG